MPVEMGPLLLCVTLVLLQAEHVLSDENIPVFVDYSALDSRYLNEDFPVGNTLGTIQARDPDNTKIKFYITGDGGEYFAIGRTTGIVTLKKELEFDTKPEEREIRMTIRIVDESLQENTADGKVFVQDVNDLRPEFSRYDIFEELTEDSAPGKVISPITVTDRDIKNEILSVTCVSPSEDFADACDKFGLFFNPGDTSNKGWKGELRLTKTLDYESRKSYAILLNAWDGKFNRTNEIHIELIDINDTPPVWTAIRPVSRDEEPKIGTVLTTVTATDGDANNAREIMYEIIPTVYPDGAEFSINNKTGEISNSQRLDYDDLLHNRGAPYEIRVKAREVTKDNPVELGDNEFTTSTAVVGIIIRDIDDNTPTFNKKEYSAFIPENIVTGGNIPGLQMTITDIDSGTFNSFDLLELDFQEVFAIIPGKGKANAGATIYIKDSEKIDYEKGPREYIIRLEARENEAPQPLTGSATVTIKVTDVNDETPSFPQVAYQKTISETAGANFLVIDIDAVDPEAGDLGTAGIRYKLYGNQQNHFQIDEVSGVITVANCNTPGLFPCIDYERKKQYILTVSATDLLGDIDKGRTRSVQVMVDIIDENDNIPSPASAYVAYIYEEQTEPVQPLIIKALDPDTVGGPVNYSLVGSSAVIGNWQITQTTDDDGDRIGTITAKRPILFSDAENPIDGSLRFQVESSDRKTSVTSDVTIFIIDINNNVPTFSRDEYETSIFENTAGDTFVITVTATDGDAPTTGNGIVDFFISDGAQGKFTVKPKAGDKTRADIYTTPDATFNYDANDKYTMTLTARDQGTPESKKGEAILIVNIIDINNKVPQITPPTVSITVAEDRAPNSNVHEVVAVDPDKSADLRYYMMPRRAQNPSGATVDKNNYNYENLFRIEETTGIVRVNNALNRELTSFIVSDLEVVDVAASPPQTGTGALFITITEVNDQDPEFDTPLYNLTINEELNINFFVRNLHCSDQDDQISRYILSQTAPRTPNFFTLMDNSGSLIVADRIDFEKIEEIRLIASCFDDGTPQRSGTADIIVTVTNINDNSPIFQEKLYSAQIAENRVGEDLGGYLLTTVSATDIDKGDFGLVRYEMANPSLPFLIDSLSGKITVKPGTVFDREITSSYGFQVIAYDSPNTPDKRKQTSVPIYLTIIDINDNCPYFEKTSYAGSIPENANIGTDMIDIIASDRDSGENKLITFSVDTSSFDPTGAESYFGVTSKSGRVFTRSTLTGKSGVYHFNVTATDTQGKNPSVMCSTDVPVQVTVTQSQNNAPEWRRPPKKDFVIYVLESQYEGMLVYDCKAEDQDPGLSGVVDYFFVEGNDQVHATNEFRINMVTGIIRAEIEFDREKVDRYFLTLVARDQGATKASSQTTLIVVILDVDDNDPVFETKNGQVVPLVLPEIDIKEDVVVVPQGLKVGQCNASDADSDHKNNRIFYEILAADDYVRNLVRVDRDTCNIYLMGKVDYEVSPELEFSIYAFNEKSDDKVRRHKRAVNPSILPVVIRITDLNDNDPQFEQDDYFACTPLESPFDSAIIDVDAHDIEQDDTDLKYSVTNEAQFRIDDQGVIHNRISFPSTDDRVFSFDAKVSDGPNLATSRVNIFVTSKSTQAMLTVNRPSSDVRRIQQKYVDLVTDPEDVPKVKFACADVKNHINDDGSVSSTKTDVYLTAIVEDGSSHTIWSGSKLYEKLSSKRRDDPGIFRTMFITGISTVEDDEFALDEDVVLAILIISILLIVFAILLFILACYCIWQKTKKKKRKVKAQRHIVVQSTVDTKGESFENPVYHNAGYVAYEDEYSTVKKAARPVNPVAIPVPENLEPLSTFQPSNLEPAEPSPPEIPDPPEPEPVIETEVMPVEDAELAPPIPRAMEPEYEDRIETVVEDGVDDHQNDYPGLDDVAHDDDDGNDDDDLPLPDPPIHEDEIETEIRDLTPPSTPEPPSY